MSIQSTLFHETPYEALKDCVRALGGTKKVASMMRPEKTIDAAATWLNDCLNEGRRDKLDFDQVLWILLEAKKIGCHSAMNYICNFAGYQAAPIEPQDEMAELQRNFIESTKHLSRMAERIEQLSAPALKRVA